jgi:Myb-like DNA-binding domain
MRPPRQRNGWTPEEDDQLRALAESGERPTAIAKHLARGEHAIRHRLYKLGIPWKRLTADSGGKEFANHYERQFMEYLRGKGWVKGTTLPASRFTSSLQQRGWIEQQVQGPKNEIFYRMTDVGLKALRAPVPAGRPAKAKGK